MYYNLHGQKTKDSPFQWITGVKDADLGREQADRLVANGDWFTVGMKQADRDEMKQWTYLTASGYGPTDEKKKKKRKPKPPVLPMEGL